MNNLKEKFRTRYLYTNEIFENTVGDDVSNQCYFQIWKPVTIQVYDRFVNSFRGLIIARLEDEIDEKIYSHKT